jgi:hypothetical protein
MECIALTAVIYENDKRGMAFFVFVLFCFRFPSWPDTFLLLVFAHFQSLSR